MCTCTWVGLENHEHFKNHVWLAWQPWLDLQTYQIWWRSIHRWPCYAVVNSLNCPVLWFTLEPRVDFCNVICIFTTDWNLVHAVFTDRQRNTNSIFLMSYVSSITIFQVTPTNKIKMTAVRPDVHGMSWLERDITKFPTENPIFEVQNTMRLFEYTSTSELVANQRWPPLTGSTYAIAYISAGKHDCKESPMAMPTFSVFNNTVGLVWRLFDVRASSKSKMAAIYRKYNSQ